jgi:uncharacterized protein
MLHAHKPRLWVIGSVIALLSVLGVIALGAYWWDTRRRATARLAVAIDAPPVHGNMAAIMEQVRRGAAVNTQCPSHGDTPLTVAATEPDASYTRALVAFGASLEQPDKYGCTALSKAARWGHTAVMEVLLSAGAAVDSRDRWGQTPLMLAIYDGRRDAAKLLVERGADVNATDTDGNTVLAWASARGEKQIGTLLRRSGAKDAQLSAHVGRLRRKWWMR